MLIRSGLGPNERPVVSQPEVATEGMKVRTRAPQGQFILERLLGGGNGLTVEVRGFELSVLDALAGGADLIDIKEPTRGPMGWADPATIAAIVEHVDGRRPVSAALGELTDDAMLPAEPEVEMAKIGLANAPSDWPDRLAQRLWHGTRGGHLLPPSPRRSGGGQSQAPRIQ